MRNILVTLLYSLTCCITITSPLDIPESEKEQIDAIHTGFEQFLGKLDYCDCKPLHGGLSSNMQYLCTVNDKKYVARILKESQTQRQTEMAAHLTAVHHGISPAVHYYYSNDNYSVMIMDFINDHTLWVQQANDQDVLDQIADKIRTISQFNPTILADQTPKNLYDFEKINQKYKKLKTLNLSTLEPMLDQALQIVTVLNQRLKHDNHHAVFSHGDLNPRNIFFTNNNIKFIDWENACMHYDLHDIASYSVFLCLNQSDDVYLLTKYLQHAPSQAEIERFKDIKLMIRAIDAFNVLVFLQNIPDSIPMETIQDFKHYETIFAQDSEQNSDEFLYALAVSQLKELLK